MLADEIIVDTSYPNYDGMQYYRYEHLLHIDCIKVLNDLLANSINCTRTLNNGQQIVKTKDFRYEEDVFKYIRILLKLNNPILYNEYWEKLMNIHKENKEYEAYLESIPKVNAIKHKVSKRNTNNKTKTENKWFRRESNNLFTGELVYEYYNLRTGESFYDSNPDLLDELNAPKPKRKKREPRKDFGKIILKFDIK